MRHIKVTTYKHSLELNGSELVDLLAGDNWSVVQDAPDFEVKVKIPEGGDYSGTPLVLDDQVELVATWSTEEVHTEVWDSML